MSDNKFKTIMIFGVSSMVGSALAEFFSNYYRVIGTYHQHRTYVKGVRTIKCDVMVKEQVQLAIFTFKPDYVIYAIGLSSVYECSKAPDYAETLNALGLFNVAEYCQRYKAQVIYISSSYVFGGVDKEYIESDIPDSLTVLGKTKASAEFFIQRTSLNYLIFRCSMMYGRSVAARQKTLLEVIQEKNELGEQMVCDNKVHHGYLDPYYLGMVIKLAIDKQAINRLFQVSSKDYYTVYDFAKIYCKVFHQLDRNLAKGNWVFPIMSSSTSSWEGGDIFFKMDIMNIENFLNIKMPTVEESLGLTYKRFMGLDKKGRSKDEGIVYI